MHSTPTKKQATQNGILQPSFTPERQPGDARGQMANYTPEDLKAQLASRPRSVRSAVSQGYAVSPRAPLTSHRSEPAIMPGYVSSMPASPSPSPSRPLMPMCDTFSSSTHSSPASFAYHNTTQSILARAQESYMLQFSPSARSMAGSYSSSSSAAGPSPRKRGQMDDDNDEVDQNDALSMSKQGLVGMKAYNDDMMDEDGDETMMMEDHGDLPLLSRSVISLSRNGVPPLSFTSSQSGTNSSSSSASSLSSSDLFFTPSSSTIAPSQQGRQMKTMPRRALGKTQSLPVEAFMSQVNTGNQLFVPDVFNATDGF